MGINNMSPASGRMLKENDTVVNKADMLEAIYNALVVNKNAGVSLTGSLVNIGGVDFAVSGGDTLRNTSTNKPTAAAAHAVIPFCYYFSVDTGVVEVTDGTTWVVI